jgi:hypothetical protein
MEVAYRLFDLAGREVAGGLLAREENDCIFKGELPGGLLPNTYLLQTTIAGTTKAWRIMVQ